MWILLLILISFIHLSASRVCVLNKCREMSSGNGDGVTCELLERLLDDLVEDEVEMDAELKLKEQNP